ncbi:MAG: hypothetical protein ABIE68_00955 [bacterium]
MCPTCQENKIGTETHHPSLSTYPDLPPDKLLFMNTLARLGILKFKPQIASSIGRKVISLNDFRINYDMLVKKPELIQVLAYFFIKMMWFLSVSEPITRLIGLSDFDQTLATIMVKLIKTGEINKPRVLNGSIQFIKKPSTGYNWSSTVIVSTCRSEELTNSYLIRMCQVSGWPTNVRAAVLLFDEPGAEQAFRSLTSEIVHVIDLRNMLAGLFRYGSQSLSNPA